MEFDKYVNASTLDEWGRTIKKACYDFDDKYRAATYADDNNDSEVRMIFKTLYYDLHIEHCELWAEYEDLRDTQRHRMGDYYNYCRLIQGQEKLRQLIYKADRVMPFAKALRAEAVRRKEKDDVAYFDTIIKAGCNSKNKT